MLFEADWPECWKIHYLVPVSKEGSDYKSRNYAGIRLSPFMSKIVGRVIGKSLVRICISMESVKISGTSANSVVHMIDLVLVYTSSWILVICNGYKFGIYLSDVSEPVDKVFKNLMSVKLHSVCRRI